VVEPFFETLPATQAQADWGEKTILELRYEQERQLIKSKQAVEKKVDQTEMNLSREMRTINDRLALNARGQSILDGLTIITLFVIIYLHGRIMNNIIIGQFVPGNSFLYRMDPRSKIMALILLMISTLNHID